MRPVHETCPPEGCDICQSDWPCARIAASKQEESCGSQLTAANRQIVDLQERIRELEEKLNTISTHAGHLFPGITIHEIFDSYAAEREVSDKMEKALNLAIEYWQHRQQRYKNRNPAWVTEARAALTEVAAIRAKSTKNRPSAPALPSANAHEPQ